MTDLGEWLDFLIAAVFSEVFGVWFLLGAVFFLLGLVILGAGIYQRIVGRRVPGRCVGAVLETRIKRKQRDGKTEEREKKTLFPVFEYPDSDGVLRQVRASEGGTSTHKYQTGQDVTVLVCQTGEHLDVYDADSYGAFYLAFGFMGGGAFLMVQVGSMLSAFGVGALSLLGLATAIAVRVFGKRASWLKSPHERKWLTRPELEPEMIHPVEVFNRDGTMKTSSEADSEQG